MLYCRKCRVNIHGHKVCCPLCAGELTGEPDEDVFPIIKQKKYNRNFSLKIISFIAITVIILAFTINVMFFAGTWWALIVAPAAVCLWISLSAAIIQRRHIFAAITWELFFITGALVLWDVCMGWKGWSLDYVIPIDCIASMLSMVIISKFLKTPVEDRLIYLALDAVYGIVPMIFIFTGCLNTIYPSAVCSSASLISIAAILLFEGKTIKEQFLKKFHL